MEGEIEGAHGLERDGGLGRERGGGDGEVGRDGRTDGLEREAGRQAGTTDRGSERSTQEVRDNNRWGGGVVLTEAD